MPGIFLPPSLSATPRLTASLIPGVREWFLVALVVVALFGRAAATTPGRFAARWLARPRRFGCRPAPRSRWVAEHWVNLVLALAGLAVCAWVALGWGVVRSSQTR